MLTTSQLETRIALNSTILPTVEHAKALLAAHRRDAGLAERAVPILKRDGNAKVAKSEPITYTLSLAQHRTSGVVNTCPKAVAACIAGCVAQNGNGAYRGVKLARRAFTTFLVERPDAFLAIVVNDLRNAVKYGERKGRPIAVRLNTYSDIAWERVAPWLFDMFPTVSFYDYSKRWDRTADTRPANYHLTFSVATSAHVAAAPTMLAGGDNVAMVTIRRKGDAPATTWNGFPVVDGDKTDYRPDDGAGVVVDLYAKGRLMSRPADGRFIHDLG